MTDMPVIHFGENSPEKVAYDLMLRVFAAESHPKDRKALLDTYAECLEAVRGNRKFKSDPTAPVDMTRNVTRLA